MAIITILAGVLLGRFALPRPVDRTGGAATKATRTGGAATVPGRTGDAPAVAGRTGGAAGVAGRTGTGTGAGAQATVARLQAQLRDRPGEPRLLTRLGAAYLARARESADPGYVTKAAEALGQSQAKAPGQPDTMTALGLLALARHDFPAALAWGERARAANPDGAEPLGVVVDAQVELGRYDAAAEAAQAMVDRRPGLASLARVSYLRELHGDSDGAAAAMEQAVTAGAGSVADLAYVRTLLGDLRLGSGRLGDAEAAYQRVLAATPGYAPAEVGLARVAAARGDLRGAAALLRPLVQRLPLPATVALLGDVEAALGDRAAARRQDDLVRAIEALNRANGVAVDLELARFEADHAREPGADPARAVAMARRARAQRPTIYGDDTLAWALRQAGRAPEALPHARAAVRLGTRDAVLWYHLAAVEADLGLDGPARKDLARAFTINPYLTNAYGTVGERTAALALARRLGLRPPAPGAPR